MRQLHRLQWRAKQSHCFNYLNSMIFPFLCTWNVISDSFDTDCIHSDIDGWSCKKEGFALFGNDIGVYLIKWTSLFSVMIRSETVVAVGSAKTEDVECLGQHIMYMHLRILSSPIQARLLLIAKQDLDQWSMALHVQRSCQANCWNGNWYELTDPILYLSGLPYF